VPLVDHVDLVVSSLDRSLPFYRGLLAPLGWSGALEQEGERGETIHYLWGPDFGGSIGLRERQSDSAGPYDRYAIGLHHLAFEAPSRAAVDRAAAWLSHQGAEIEGGPGERHYTPGYYAVFFLDPDGIKLEVVHRPRPFSLSFARGLVRGAGSIAARRRR
jgi:glyoxylase I family protein